MRPATLLFALSLLVLGCGPASDGGDGQTPAPDASTGGSEGEDSVRTQLLGVWEGVAMEDSGGPREEAPPGTLFIFREDGTVVRSCDATGGPTWALTEDGGTILVESGSGEPLEWRILTLTETELSFSEGPDVFHLERRPDC